MYLPSIEETTLNKDGIKKYRVLSKLSFLSKILGKVMINQQHSHKSCSNTFNHDQSVYRKFHSTESAPLEIHNDVLASMDAVTPLTMVDISAVSDTIDHPILLGRFDDWFGVTS